MQTAESQRIKELRGKETLREFGEKFGISHSTVDAIEKGKQSISIPVAKKIAKEYNVTLDWLYGISEQKYNLYTEDSTLDQHTLTEPKQEYISENDVWKRIIEEKDKQIDLLTSFLKSKDFDLDNCREQVTYFKNLYDQSGSKK